VGMDGGGMMVKRGFTGCGVLCGLSTPPLPGLSGFHVVAWKGLGPRSNLMVSKYDTFVFKCRLGQPVVLPAPKAAADAAASAEQVPLAEEAAGEGSEELR
jgi:hypothetical protein